MAAMLREEIIIHVSVALAPLGIVGGIAECQYWDLTVGEPLLAQTEELFETGRQTQRERERERERERKRERERERERKRGRRSERRV